MHYNSNILLSIFKFPFPESARHTDYDNCWEASLCEVRRWTDKAPPESSSVPDFILWACQFSRGSWLCAPCSPHSRTTSRRSGLSRSSRLCFLYVSSPPAVNECVMDMKLPKKPKNLGKHSPSITQRFNAAKWFNDKEGVTVKYKAGPGLQQRLLSRLRNPKWIPGRSTMPGCGVLAWSSYTVITVQQSWNLNDSGLSPFKQQKEGQFL